MSKLYDHSSGKWVDVAEDQVTDLVKSGKYTFEQGIEIPVVGSDGQLYNIPSDKAFEAFTKFGNRWATQGDKSQWEAEQSEAIKQEHYGDNLGTAAAAGILRGATGGLSDVAVTQLAPELEEGLKENKERSPIVSTLGEVAGIATTPIGKLGNFVSKSAEAATAAKLAGLVGETAAASRASKALQAALPTVAGSVAEGALFGATTGISEAALGKPDEVVDNLVAGLGLGALTGGVFGSVLGGAKASKPFLSAASDAVADVVDAGVQKAAQFAAKKGILATLDEAGEKELSALVRDGLIDTPAGQAIRQLAESGEWKAAKELADTARAQRTAMEREAKALEKGARDYVTKHVPKEEQKLITEALERSANDAVTARNELYKSYQQADDILRQEIATLQGPPVLGGLADDLDNLIGKAAATGDAAAVSKADELLATVQRQLRDATTEGAEINGLRNIKSALDHTTIGSIKNADARKAFLELENSLNQTLKNHPREFVAESFDKGNQIYRSISELGKMIGKQHPNMTAVGRLVTNPEKQAQVIGFINNLDNLAPELTAFGNALKNADAQKEALTSMQRKMAGMELGSATGKLSIDDIKELVTEFGLTKGGIKQRLEKLESLKGTLDGLDQLSPLEQAVRLERAVKAGPSTLEKYLPMEQKLAAVERLKGMNAEGSTVGQFVGSSIGNMVAGPAGGIAGQVIAGGMSPAKALKLLNKVERASYEGTRKLSNAFKKTVDALTGPAVTRATRISSGVIVDRERFNQIKDQLGEMNSAEAMMGKADEIVARHSPQIHSAMMTKISTATAYLSQHIPADPLAGYTINPKQSAYKPSDMEVSKFMRRVQAVNSPVQTIELIAEGRATAEAVDALKTVHPELYNKLQTELLSGIMNAEKPVAYQNRLVLSQVFGIPTDYSLLPQFTAKMQAQFAPAGNGGGRPTEGSNGIGQTKTQMARKSVDFQPMQSVLTEAQQTQYDV